MKALPFRELEQGGMVACPEDPHSATHVLLHVPGPLPSRMIPVLLGNKTRKGTPCWSWNGSMTHPTLRPSVLTKGQRHPTDEEYDRIMTGEVVDIPHSVCHSWVTDGKIQFLEDCKNHPFTGQTLDLFEVEF